MRTVTTLSYCSRPKPSHIRKLASLQVVEPPHRLQEMDPARPGPRGPPPPPRIQEPEDPLSQPAKDPAPACVDIARMLRYSTTSCCHAPGTGIRGHQILLRGQTMWGCGMSNCPSSHQRTNRRNTVHLATRLEPLDLGADRLGAGYDCSVARAAGYSSLQGLPWCAWADPRPSGGPTSIK